MIKDIEYYTGMVLEAYTADMGFTIGTGGRYDHLIHQFGYGCPATGFALGIERIMLALSRQDGWTSMPNFRVLCLGLAEGPKLAWQTAEKLRAKGFPVELAVDSFAEDEILEYAVAQGFRWVIQPLTRSGSGCGPKPMAGGSKSWANLPRLWEEGFPMDKENAPNHCSTQGQAAEAGNGAFGAGRG